MELTVGSNEWGLMRIVVEARQDGSFKATFPDWQDPYTGEAASVEANTIPALTAAAKRMLGIG